MTERRERPDSIAIGPGERVAVVAGSGSLPRNIVEQLVRAGQRPVVVAIEGEAEIGEASDSCDFIHVAPSHLALVPARVKKMGVTHMVLAGGMGARPPMRSLRFSPKLLLQLPRLVAAYARGDDGLLRAIIGYVEGYGIRVVGAHQIVPDLLAGEEVLTGARPRKEDAKDISAAIAAARAIGRLDIGQAAIAIGGRTVAMEDIEGTDGLLQRAQALRSHGRLAGKARGVLVKCAKPQQEARADLPTIGPQTVTAAHAAGLAGIAVEAERSFILDSAETIRRADELGLFVLGFARGREQ